MRTTLAILLALTGTQCFAGKATDLKPTMTQPGKLIVDESFTGTALGKSWAVAKGDWQVRDGMVVGKEKESDKHAAVLALNHPNRNSIIRFSFKLDGAKLLSLSLNHAKGHLFRVNIDTNGLAVVKDADKKDPQSKPVPLGKAPGKFEAGQWYTVLVEIDGAKVAVQTDNDLKLTGNNPGLDMDKTGYRFVTRGESLLVSDLKVWELQP